VEQQRLHLYFIDYIHKVGQELKLRQKALATASVFFRRFYVKASFADYDPRLVAPTMIFLATKVEECNQSTKAFKIVLTTVGSSAGGKQNDWTYTMNDILQCEYHALEVLGSDLIVYHPYRPLSRLVQESDMGDCLQMAWRIVNDSYRTDLCLLHPPYLIAIAAMYMSCVFGDIKYDAWLEQLNVETDTLMKISKTMLELYDSHERANKDTGSGATLPLSDDLLLKLTAVHGHSTSTK